MAQLKYFLNEKKVIIFGASENAKRLLANNNIVVEYFVDNDDKKWGGTFLNHFIKAPDILLNEKKDNIYIIVASIYYPEIAEQLKKLGFFENLNFCNGSNYLYADKINSDFPQKFINDIKHYTIDDYEKVEAKAIGFLKSNYNLISIYNFGSISTPSISDIDLLLYFNESPSKLEEIKIKFRHYLKENKYEYFFCHDPLFLNQQTFKYLSLFHTVTNFNKVFGKDLNYEQGNYEYEKTLIWNYYFYKRIWRIRTNSEFNFRQSGMLIKNMFHSIKNNSILFKQNSKEINLIDIEKKVEEIRSKILSKELTVSYFLNAVDDLWEIIRFQENFQIGKLSEVCQFDINYLPAKYKELYNEIISEKSEYVIKIKKALEEMDISYSQARKLFGALPMFEIPYYV